MSRLSLPSHQFPATSRRFLSGRRDGSEHRRHETSPAVPPVLPRILARRGARPKLAAVDDTPLQFLAADQSPYHLFDRVGEVLRTPTQGLSQWLALWNDAD